MKTLRSRLGLLLVRWAIPAGAAVRFTARVLPGMAGLGLVSIGAWMAWPPAGFMTAGCLILVDRAYTHVKGGRES